MIYLSFFPQSFTLFFKIKSNKLNKHLFLFCQHLDRKMQNVSFNLIFKIQKRVQYVVYFILLYDAYLVYSENLLMCPDCQQTEKPVQLFYITKLIIIINKLIHNSLSVHECMHFIQKFLLVNFSSSLLSSIICILHPLTEPASSVTVKQRSA